SRDAAVRPACAKAAWCPTARQQRAAIPILNALVMTALFFARAKVSEFSLHMSSPAGRYSPGMTVGKRVCLLRPVGSDAGDDHHGDADDGCARQGCGYGREDG